jgi:hypothetical protein
MSKARSVRAQNNDSRPEEVPSERAAMNYIFIYLFICCRMRSFVSRVVTGV